MVWGLILVRGGLAFDAQIANALLRRAAQWHLTQGRPAASSVECCT
jgi:hypothetical protein